MTEGVHNQKEPGSETGASIGVTARTVGTSGVRADGWHDAKVSARLVRQRGALYVAAAVVRNMRRYGVVLVAYSVGQPLIYLLAMGLGLGNLVAGNNTELPGGVAYLVFLAPAILISTTVMAAATEFTFPVMGGFKWQRTYYGPHATAISPSQIAQGVMLGVGVRLLFGAVAFWIFMLIFGTALKASAVLVIPIAVLAGLAFGLPIMAYAATIREEKFQFATVQRFVIMPLFLFSGTFFPLSVLPGYLQWIGWLSPIWHGTELARIVSFDYPQPAWLSGVHAVVLVGFAVAGYVLSVRNFKQRFDE